MAQRSTGGSHGSCNQQQKAQSMLRHPRRDESKSNHAAMRRGSMTLKKKVETRLSGPRGAWTSRVSDVGAGPNHAEQSRDLGQRIAPSQRRVRPTTTASPLPHLQPLPRASFQWSRDLVLDIATAAAARNPEPCGPFSRALRYCAPRPRRFFRALRARRGISRRLRLAMKRPPSP